MEDQRHNSSDAFIGYQIRAIQGLLERVIVKQRMQDAHLTRIERKIDALGQDMTPQERAAVIKQIDEAAAKITTVAEGAEAFADKLDQTGV